MKLNPVCGTIQPKCGTQFKKIKKEVIIKKEDDNNAYTETVKKRKAKRLSE